MNPSKQKKNTCLLKKKTQLSNFQEKEEMALKLFEFLEQFIIDAFLIKLPNLRKLDQWVKFYFSGKSDN